MASLTDEEVERVKAFISGGSQAGKAPAVARAPGSSTATLEAAADAGAVRREDYIASAGTVVDKVPVLPERNKRKKATNGEPSPKPAAAKPGAMPKLTPLPTVSQPVPPSEPAEMAPQKPDLRLPIDAIKAASRSGGTKPLIDHVRKQQGKRHEPSEGAPAAKPSSFPRDRPTRPKEMIGGDTAGPPVARGRRGAPGKATPADEPGLLGGREQRQLSRRRTGTETRARTDEEEAATPRRRSSHRVIKRTGTNTAAPRKSKVTLQLPCTVRSFSEAIGVSAPQVLRQMLTLGTVGNVNINSEIDPDTAELLAVGLGVEVDFKQAIDLAEQTLAQLSEEPDDPTLLEPRPPVITFLGHVDHGKTSLLDRIIGIDVVSGESGGITQHIRAYSIEKDGRKISFVDTPGHEAFTEMRARGANVTDIAVLVVAADDGVMPQTEEAISHAKAADVPIVVALNKIDLPGIDTQRIYQQLAANDLLPTEWGGDTEVVKTSATIGTGIDELLETLLTLAELRDYRANPNRAASGTCLEAELHEGRGVVAKLIVQNGTLRVGDAIVCGAAYGRVKAMYDTLRTDVTHHEAGPSMPVNVTGLNIAPAAGERFYVLDDIATARQIADDREGKSRRAALGGAPAHVTLENLFDRLGQKEAADAQHHLAGRRARLDRSDPEGAHQARASGSQDQGAASHGRRHHRGRRAPGRRLGRDHHRLQRGARRKGPHAGRARGVQIRRYDIIYQADRRFEGRLGRHAQAGAARSRTGPGPGAADVHDQPRGHDRRLPRAGRRRAAQRPGARDPRQPDHRRLPAGIAEARERTTPAKCAKAWNAASSWAASTT